MKTLCEISFECGRYASLDLSVHMPGGHAGTPDDAGTSVSVLAEAVARLQVL